MSKQFSDLGINEHLLQSLIDQQISEPTDIQKKVIPVILEQNKDVVARPKQEPVRPLPMVCLYYN
tara:strand:+ start:191 stop:385 length:195 start_codon:yes stop_codon:yes gene_type:complete